MNLMLIRYNGLTWQLMIKNIIPLYLSLALIFELALVLLTQQSTAAYEQCDAICHRTAETSDSGDQMRRQTLFNHFS